MPIIKSAKKRVRIAKKATVRNAKTKRTLRSTLKAFHAAVTGKSKVNESQAKAHSAIDKAVKKGVMSKQKAARRKSRLSAAAKAAGTGKPVAKKAVAKKTAPKKAAAKKPAAKKTAKK